MKLLFKIVLILLVAVSLALFVKYDTGYVYLAFGNWEAEAALSLSILLMLAFYFILNRGLKLISNLWNLSGNVQHWQHLRRTQQAVTSCNQAMLAMAEGHWRQAERKLIRHIQFAEMPVNNYLYAARAAQQQGEIERRDYYLMQAYELTSKSSVPVDITRAELQLSQRQLEPALASLKQLRKVEPKNEYVLKMLLDLYKDMGDWQGIREIMPDLKKRNLVSDEEFAVLEMQAYTNLIEQSGNRKTAGELQKNWGLVPRHLKENPKLLYYYASKMIHYGQEKEVEPLLRNYLKKSWDERIVALYSNIDIETIGKNYSQIESLAEQHGKSPMLLLTLGKLCLKNKLWGKAKLYFESSIGSGASVEAYNELGKLQEQMGEQHAALECYRKGMLLGMKQAS